jgi:hypothetical protein
VLGVLGVLLARLRTAAAYCSKSWSVLDWLTARDDADGEMVLAGVGCADSGCTDI